MGQTCQNYYISTFILQAMWVLTVQLIQGPTIQKKNIKRKNIFYIKNGKNCIHFTNNVRSVD